MKRIRTERNGERREMGRREKWEVGGNASSFHKCPSQANGANAFTMLCSYVMANILGISLGNFPITLAVIFLKSVN